MAAKKAGISISIIADAAKARAGFKQAEDAAGNLSNQLKNVGKSVAGAFATQAIFNFAKGALDAAEAASTSRSRIEQVATSMNLFGDQVGAVTDRLSKLADQTARNTGIDQNQIKLTQAKLLTIKELAKTADQVGGAFDRATMAAIDMAAAGFGEASTNAVQLGKALQDPIKGITALGRSGITFTEQQKAVIASLVETNKIGEAQALILNAIEEQIGGVAEATANDTDKMRVSFTQLKESVGEALVPVFATLLEVIKPIIDAFVSLPDGVQKVVVIAALAGGTFKSLSTSIQGLGVAAGTVNKALGAVGLVLTAAIGIYSIYSGKKREAAARTADFVEALKAEAGGQADATDKHIANLLSSEDLRNTYEKLGFTTQQLADIIQGEQSPAFEQLQTDLAATSDGTGDYSQKVNDLAEKYGVSAGKLRSFVDEILGQRTALADAEAQLALNNQTQEELGIVTEQAARATDELNQSLEEQENALNAIINATLAQFNAQLGYESQTWRTKDAVDAFTQAQLDATFGTEDAEAAARAVTEAQNAAAAAALSQAAAAAKLAEDQAEAAGSTLSAAEAAAIQVQELQKVAETLDPSSQLRQQLQQYITELTTKIPRNVRTQLEIAVTAWVEQMNTGGGAGGGQVKLRAQGGPVSPTLGPYIVGEQGPELFVPGQTGMILPNTALIDSMTRKTTGATTTGTQPIIINVAGSVISENDLIETVRKGLLNAQRNGAKLVYTNT